MNSLSQVYAILFDLTVHYTTLPTGKVGYLTQIQTNSLSDPGYTIKMH